MDWQEIIISIVSVAITALITWGLTQLKSWVNNKIKNSKCAEYLSRAVDVVGSCVKVTYQTYVEALKSDNAFSKEAQKNALNQAKESAKAQLSCEVQDYISSTFGDIDRWIETQIESAIYDLKK